MLSVRKGRTESVRMPDTVAMIQLRAIVPAAMSIAVVDLLEQAPHVSALAIHRGAGLRPPGDVITADVAREGANAVIDGLREIGVAREGTLHVEEVPTWLSRAALDAEEAAPGASADAVVWAEVANRSYAESELNWTYLSFMVMATMLAAIAIVLDSQVLTIGAMVLGPEFAPVAAIGLALVRRRPKLLRHAVRTLVLGFLAAIAVTMLFCLVGRALGWITLDTITSQRSLTSFIYHPDRWSVCVAVIAAAAGVLSLTSARMGGLSGVFISVTTIPAAGNLALGLAFLEWHEVRGSALQLAINITAMALAGWATLSLQGFVWSRVSVWRPAHVGRPPLA
jgi:uncharacterized hydrophobic protein (TIGR00271 family)